MKLLRLPPLTLFLLPLIALAAETSSQPGPSAEPVTKGQRIFSCAHSFLGFMPPLLNEWRTAGGHPDQTIVGTSNIGGSQVIQHWNVPDEKNQAKPALRAGEVDVLTLSPFWLPDAGIENFATLAYEHNPNVRVTIQEFWLPNDFYGKPYPAVVDRDSATVVGLKKIHEPYFADMETLAREINKKLGKDVVLVVPTGQAVIALREKVIAGQAPGLTTQSALFTDKWGHGGAAIKVLASYCHYAVIYRKSPVGLPVPKMFEKERIPADKAEALNRLLQEIAWDAVRQHPMSGVKG